MTVTEMIKRIDEQCMENFSCDWCPLNPTSCKIYHTDNDVKNTYELMFGKEETEIKNEFKIKDIKAGYLVRIKEDEKLLLAIQTINGMDFYDKKLDYVCSEPDIGFDDNNEYCIIEVYGYYDDAELFDISDRPLLYKEDINKKQYRIGVLTIAPNYEKGYKTGKEDFICIDDVNNAISINKSEIDDVINALTEIRDFIKEG